MFQAPVKRGSSGSKLARDTTIRPRDTSYSPRDILTFTTGLGLARGQYAS